MYKKFLLEENKETINQNEDSNDSDVQYVDSDTEIVNDKLTQKLQRLHLDDRVNIPDENGNNLISFTFRYFIHYSFLIASNFDSFESCASAFYQMFFKFIEVLFINESKVA